MAKRTPETMVHTKRLFLASVWIKDFWTEGGKTLVRRYYIIDPKRDMMIVTDASPWGLGAVLVLYKTGMILEGATAALTAKVAALLGITVGDSGAQGVVEALAMFVYLRFWSRFFARRERIPLMKSDSCAALGAHRNGCSGSCVQFRLIAYSVFRNCALAGASSITTDNRIAV